MDLKKIAVTVLASAVIFSNISNVSYIGGVKAETEVSDDVALLNAIGISATDADGYITRGDFTALMVQASGVDYEGLTTETFSDVDEEQNKYIAAAERFGYVNGTAPGKFSPDNIISVKDAMTIALRVLGFGNADEKGMRENMIELLELGKALPDDGDLKCSYANILIMNMLEAGYAVYDGENLEVSEEDFMYKAHGVYRHKGVLNGTKGISLPEYPQTREYQVCIDNTVFENEADIGYEYLGCQMTVYIKDYDDYSALIWAKGVKNDTLVLTGAEIEDVNGFDKNDSKDTYISYSDKNNSLKTKKLESDASVYINRVNTAAVTNADLMGKSSRVTVIDTDDNNYGDIIVVERYDYYMTEAVDYSSGVIYSKDNKPEIKTQNFFTEDIDIIYDNKEAGIEEIKGSIVLALMCTYTSDDKIDTECPIVIEILNNTVDGRVDFVGDENIVSINDIQYEYVDTENEIPQAGDFGKFYIGKFNEIVYWDSDISSDGLSYGYLMKVIPEDDEGIVYAVIYDTKENKHTFKLSGKDKVKYSGEIAGNYVSNKSITKDKLCEYFPSKQLVRYKADKDTLVAIQKAVDCSEDSAYEGYDEERFSLDYIGGNERLYAQFLSENYKISTNTIMVGVSKNGTSDEDVAVGGYDFFGTDVSGLDIKIYDSSKTFVPTVVVLTFDKLDSAAKKPNNSFVNTKNAAVITKRYTKINSDNENVTAYQAYCGGVLVEIEPSDEALYDVKGTNWARESKRYFNELEVGDVIQYGTDSKGRVNLLHVIHDHDDVTPRYTMFNNNNHLSEMNTAFGRVDEFESESYFKLNCSDSRKYPFGRYAPNVYLYDVSTGNIERLLTLTNLSEDDYVFVRCARADVKDIVIYRNE